MATIREFLSPLLEGQSNCQLWKKEPGELPQSIGPNDPVLDMDADHNKLRDIEIAVYPDEITVAICFSKRRD